jgi:hypothetical protein
MEMKLTCPGVKHGCDAESSAEPFGISAEGEQCRACSGEKEIETGVPVSQEQLPELLGQCEHEMEVMGRQNALLAL